MLILEMWNATLVHLSLLLEAWNATSFEDVVNLERAFHRSMEDLYLKCGLWMIVQIATLNKKFFYDFQRDQQSNNFSKVLAGGKLCREQGLIL